MRRYATAMAVVLALGGGFAWAQSPPMRPGDAVYTCIDDHGHALRRDRYIDECRHKEQRVLNRDGSLRRVVPPTLTAEELAQREAAERAAREAQAAQADAVKYDRLLLIRYPDEAAHDRARSAALEDSRSATARAEARLRDLAVERRRLLAEAEFYRGRLLPSALKQQLEANDAAAEAQRDAIARAQAERDRINRRFDVERERLRKLLRGVMPGSLGPPPP